MDLPGTNWIYLGQVSVITFQYVKEKTESKSPAIASFLNDNLESRLLVHRFFYYVRKVQ